METNNENEQNYDVISEQQQSDLDLLDSYLLSHPKLLLRLLVEQHEGRLGVDEQQYEDNDNINDSINSRGKRRISVFNSIYQQCRIQKRREKNVCLYLANLYQNLKGFHGL